MRLGQRRLEEANAWGHAQARLTSSRGAARESGESEARRPNTGTIPDGGLARHPMEERPPACLPPPKADGPRHATWSDQDGTHAPDTADKVMVGTVARGTARDPVWHMIVGNIPRALMGCSPSPSCHDGNSPPPSGSLARQRPCDVRGYRSVAVAKNAHGGFQPHTPGHSRRSYAKPWNPPGKRSSRRIPRACAPGARVGMPWKPASTGLPCGPSPCSKLTSQSVVTACTMMPCSPKRRPHPPSAGHAQPG